MDYWTITSDAIVRHHRLPRRRLYVPDPEDFPVPLKYIDVFRFTETDLDGTTEKHVYDIWLDEKDRPLADPWTGRTSFTLLRPRRNDGKKWVVDRPTRKQKTERPPHIYPEIWKDVFSRKDRREASKERWQ